MRAPAASFSVRFLTNSTADQTSVDRALSIFVRNTSALLRTKTNQIREKMARPDTPEGRFYFAAFYRGAEVTGFAMFGYYPRTKLVVFDHMVIEDAQRGAGAFYAFAQLLYDAIESVGLDVDFTAVEVEKEIGFGGSQAGGPELVRLLGQIGFGEVHARYVLANMEPKNYGLRYEGTLMLRASQKLYRIRREDLEEIYDAILFDHYLPWYRDFFGKELGSYRKHLAELSEEFRASLRDSPVVMINGPERDQLKPLPLPKARTPEVKAAWYVGLFIVSSLVMAGILIVLKVSFYLAVPLLLIFLGVFAGVVATSTGKSFEVFDRLIKYFGGTHKSRYQPQLQSNASQQITDPDVPLAPQALDDASRDIEC